jgi:hypothetical protein
VVDPLVADRADVHLGAERALVRIALRALVDERALLARNGAASLSPSMKYWRISGRMNSSRKRRWPITG